MSQEVAVVFTAKSIGRILKEGGTQSWRLNRAHARRCTYAICTRNTQTDWGDGNEPHLTGFLIGKISDVVPCGPTPEDPEPPEKRFLIRFSEFARIDIPDFWKGDRNPVKYMNLEDSGIDVSKLKWQKMPPKAAVETKAVPGKTGGLRPLTMAEAKKGLAMTFGVQPDAIEITIRG